MTERMRLRSAVPPEEKELEKVCPDYLVELLIMYFYLIKMRDKPKTVIFH